MTTDPAGSDRRMPRMQPMYHRVFRANSMAVRTALLELRHRFDHHVSADTIGRLELALAEVLNNISEHGGDEHPSPAAPPKPRKAPPTLARPSADSRKRGGVPTVHLCVVQQASGLACAVTDDGIPLPENCLTPFESGDFKTYRSREQLEGELPEGGFGWFLIQDLTRAICYYREDQRNFLAFTIPYPEGANEETGREGPAQITRSER